MANKKILIVDDSHFITTMLSKVLSSENFEVMIAHSGEECFNILNLEKVDLLIVDMILPEMSGREIVEKIRSNPKLKDTKVIFFTSTTFSDLGKKELEFFRCEGLHSEKF